MKNTFALLFLIALVLASCQSDNSDSKSEEMPTNLEQEILGVENGLMPYVQLSSEDKNTSSIQEQMKELEIAGVSVAVVKNSKVLWAKGYGIANKEEGLSVDENTLFQAASISKPLSSLAILKMADLGQVNLDTDVNEYLKGWKVPESEFTKDEKVTLRRLMSHTAGLTVHGFGGYHAKESVPNTTQILEGEGNSPEVTSQSIPGTEWSYSGGGYVIIQKVIEDLSGIPFDKYMELHVLKPLGMMNSSYTQPLAADKEPNASSAFDYEGNTIPGRWNIYPEMAPAGLWTNPTDLAKYSIAVQNMTSHADGAFLSPEMTDQMLTKTHGDWGLGPSLRNEGDSLVFGHGGRNQGFMCDLTSYAHLGYSLVIMTNSDNSGEFMDQITRSFSNYYDLGLSDQLVITPVEMELIDLELLAGTYEAVSPPTQFSDGWNMEIKLVDGALMGSDRGYDYDIIPVGEGKFINPDDGVSLVFDSEDKNAITFEIFERFTFKKVN